MGAPMNAAVKSAMVRVPIGSPEYAQILEWLYQEARLLDCGDFVAWLALMTSDISYEMPTRSSVLRKEVLVERDANDAYHINCSVLVTRIRSDRPIDLLTGERRDVLRKQDGGLKLLRRQILLDQTVLESHNLSFFF